MNCSITTSSAFDKAFKALAKRYPSLRTDLVSFVEEIRENPTMGTQLGHNLRKVRFAISSKGKGKSGGARVITHTVLFTTDGADVTLLTIYDKSEQLSVSDKELKKLLKDNNLE
jgi:hypothetical protein